MKCLVTTVYCEVKAADSANFFLLEITPKLLEELKELHESVNDLQKDQDGIISIQRWLPGRAFWVDGYRGPFDETRGAWFLEEAAEEHAVIEVSLEEAKEMGSRKTDVVTVHARPETSGGEFYVTCRQGHLRLESRAFTLEAMEQDVLQRA